MTKSKKAKTIAIIPARGSSKRIPKKNLIDVNGLPLIVYTIMQAINSSQVDEVWVSTDDDEIERVSKDYGAKIVRRTGELANDNATSESALLHVLDERAKNKLVEPEYIVFLQCTSPVRKPNDIDNALSQLINSESDSLLTVCENKRFLWKYENNYGQPINYDYKNRLREQDMEPQFQENGSIYICKTDVLRTTKNRLGKKISFYIMDYWCSFQVDDAEDVELVSWILSRHCQDLNDVVPPNNIELIIMDFDGVMTDDTAYIDDKGNESVRVSRSDGWGIARLKEAGFKMIVLSTETNIVVKKRCEKLGIQCEQSVINKLKFMQKYLKDNKLEFGNIIYVGNDVNDIECMKKVAYPVAVDNAHPKVKNISRFHLSRSGGAGAIRELADWLLRNKNINVKSNNNKSYL